MADKILLTGRPGVGKTTVVQRLIATGAPLAGGFVTEEIRSSR
jgi:nucleoside-triphosphatase THEP1